MKEKRNYSLTAKERKQKRYGKPQTAEINPRAEAENAALIAQKRSKRSAVVVSAVLAVAVLLIMIALIAPVIAYLVNPYRDYDTVIARFTLSNGMVLEYEIDEQRYDIAATNFIFLAKNGYFDNTVFFDAQNGWLRFGGYEQQPSAAENSSTQYSETHHRSQNKTYCEGFAALPSSRFTNVLNKFGYNLYEDKGGTNISLVNQVGSLTYLYDNTSTEFQFCVDERAINDIPALDGSNKQYTASDVMKPTMVGNALNDETIENLLAIYANAKLNTTISYGYRWMPPDPTIFINEVKVYNLDDEKWRDFDFIKYMDSVGSDGRKRLKGWTGRS